MEQKQNQEVVIDPNQPSTIQCAGVDFNLSPISYVQGAKRLHNSYLFMLMEGEDEISYYHIDRDNTQEKKLLNCNFIDLTAKQWVDVVGGGVYIDQYGEKRPSPEACDLVKGILIVYRGLKWETVSYLHGLGDLRNYGLEFVKSNRGSDWDTKIRVHHIGHLHANNSMSHQECKKGIVKAIDSIFLSHSAGTMEYPPFFKHWHDKLVAWASGDEYEDPHYLINHSLMWPWSSRLSFLEKMYTCYKSSDDSRDIAVKAAIDEAVFEITGGTEDWVKEIPANTPFERVYNFHKILHPKPNLFLYARAASTGHMHDKIYVTYPPGSTQKKNSTKKGSTQKNPTKKQKIQCYKYIFQGGPEEGNCKKPRYLEKEISRMFPLLVVTIVEKLVSRSLFHYVACP